MVLELVRRQVEPLPSESAVYRCLIRAGVIEAVMRHRRKETWERGEPMELWQMDTVGGFLLADGTSAKALTGVDDHSRFCVSARLMPRERTQLVCDGFAAALKAYGTPAQVLTDNGKVFTGRYSNELLKTVARTSTGEIRNKRAAGTAKRTRMSAEWDTSAGRVL